MENPKNIVKKPSALPANLDPSNTLSFRYCLHCNSIYFEENEFSSHSAICPHRGVLLFRVGNSFLKKDAIENNKRFCFFLKRVYSSYMYFSLSFCSYFYLKFAYIYASSN